MTDIDVETLIPDPKLHTRVVMGRLSQIHRGECVAEEGDTFDVQGSTFEVVSVTERTIDDIGISDVRRECSTTPDQYFARLEQFDGPFEEGDTVYCFRFERQPSLDIGE